ncbi:unnamed protein product [Phyllotreta striolata]|uniref:Peptidase S1 domain-containing protein n=1 Tax=Phyllotreta striolata TaxID=444603 RepID=A0A9N9THA8_PHYSR|nr:unnamed protein product [Phyllotreta striolata]
MQPAFITNNVGATTGRNIRNLPCISRRNSNQSGFCMFAIDCLKANGTHLGTCIDGFYFGSCCYIEPVHNIVDNAIDTDIIPHREPPFRISSTTKKTTIVPLNESTTISFENTTTSTPTVGTTTGKTPATTLSQKLSTFQMIDGNTLEEVSTKASLNITTTSTTTIKSTTPQISTQNITISTTEKSSSSISTTSATTTKVPTKITSKPTSAVSKLTTTSKRPEISSTKTRTTSKPTKKTSSSTKPTKRTTTSKVTTAKPSSTSQKTKVTSTTTEKTKPSPSASAKPAIITTTNLNNITLTTTQIVVSNKNSTTSTTSSKPDLGNYNTTTEDWVPIILLNQTLVENSTQLPQNQTAQTTAITESSSIQINTTFSPLTTASTITSTLSTISPYEITNATTESTTVSQTPQTDSNIFDRPVNMSDYTDVCGRRMFPEARIVGGEKSSFGKWPWQLSLRQWRTSTYLHKCGAALLNENWAITAAHCVDNVPPSDLLLRLGEYDLSTESEPYLHQERRVQIVASHPQFDPRTFEYDLALLRFYEPVNFQPNIVPVCVPQTDENFVSRTAFVTGWGRLYEDGPLPSILQEVSVPVINNTVCESMYRSAGYIEHIPHIFICAGWRRGGFDSCEGDSGGPMVIQRPDKRFLLAGIISWGIGCAEPNQPGVYTRISEFRDWINQILQF